MKRTLELASLILMAALTGNAQSPGTGVNFNHATPAAPSGARNVTFQSDSTRPTVNMSAYVTYPTVQVACPGGSDLAAAVNSCLASLPSPTGGICDARACSNNYTWNTATTISGPNEAILLPCGTLTATVTVTVSATVRNSTIHGCAYQGGSASSGTSGGSVWNYQGNGTAFVIGDTGDASDTPGFYMTDLTLATANAGTSAHAIDFHRVQEVDIERVYFIGNNGTGQTGITLDGTGNYSGGTFQSFRLSNFGTGLNMTGNGTGAANASTFTRMHIDCPTSGGSPITGGLGVNLAYGDGNTFVGGDIEGCDTMLSLGAGAANNTFTGVRNENSNTQISAASGSQYNLWLTGGTMFTGKLTDAGTHNSFWDAFHREFNNLNGDLWRAQADATITNHIYTGIGLGNVRGRQDEYVTDVPSSPGNYQNAWLWGPGGGTSGTQVWTLTDLINNVGRLAIGQLTTAGGNNQTLISSAGTGNVCINCNANSGTGGIVISGGGATPSEVAGFDGSGNETILGQLNFYSGATEAWELECNNTASCTIFNANATTPGRVFKANTNGQTDIDSESTAAVTVNNTSTGGTGGFIVYEGGANSSTAAFTVTSSGATSQPSNSQVGSASGAGNQTIGNHLNQLATADFAGSCAISSGTTCTISFQHSWTSQPACSVTPGFSVGQFYWYTWATNVVTVHEASNSNGTFYVICAGNPN